MTKTSAQLNKRIRFLTPSTVQDASGGPGPDVPGNPIWASIDSVSGQNLYQGQFVSEATHLVTIRYRPGITPSMRIAFGTRVFNILVIGDPREANVWLDIQAQEVL